jgi:hypothetical protein
MNRKGYNKSVKRPKLVIVISIFSVLIISLFIIYQKNKLNKNWMEKDRRLIKEIAFLLNQNNIDYTNIFLDGYGETPFINGKKLGLGYTLDRFNHYGGYMNVNILVLADSFGNIIKNKIIIYGNKRVAKILDKEYNLSYFNNMVVNNYGDKTYYFYTNINENDYAYFIEKFMEYFDINNNVVIPIEIENDYKKLTDPFSNNVYGYKIGFDSIIPPERKAITKILETNDINILFSIIASPNPEGRIYAIESIFLNYLNEDNNEIIKKLVNKISYLKVDVFVGAGCVIHNEMIDSDEKIQFIIDNYYKRYKDSE